MRLWKRIFVYKNINMALIQGGYYLKARSIQNSEIAHCPPHIREIWDWLIKEANHKDCKTNGKIIMRGEVFCSYEDIIEGLSWYVGWRKTSYSRSDCETAMKWLRKATMITTRKTTRGMVISIVNYDKYQNPTNYENHTETYRRTTLEPQTRHTINKNEKNEKKEIVLAADAVQVVQILKVFQDINPTIDYGNTTERKAASELIGSLGFDKALQVARYAVSVQGKQYSPTITTPYKLKIKLGDLKVYADRERSRAPRTVSI